MKLITHTPCMYTKLALQCLFSNLLSHIKGHLIIIDSKSFKSVSEIYWLVRWYSHNYKDVKVAIILNKKFIKAGRNTLICGVDIQDNVSTWGYIIKNIIKDEKSLRKSLSCLKNYATNHNFSKKTLVAMSLIADRKSVAEIAGIMDIKPKSAYGYVSKLKCAFHQPTINHLYSFLGELKTATLNANIVGTFKITDRGYNGCIVKKRNIHAIQ